MRLGSARLAAALGCAEARGRSGACVRRARVQRMLQPHAPPAQGAPRRPPPPPPSPRCCLLPPSAASAASRLAPYPQPPPLAAPPTHTPRRQEYNIKMAGEKKKFESWLAAQPYDDEVAPAAAE